MFEFERTTSIKALEKAWKKVSAKNATQGIDQISVAYYRENLNENLQNLHCALVTSQYVPYREKVYSFGGRHIFISCLEDKIVQTTAANVISENVVFTKSVHGFIKGKSIFTAKKSLYHAIHSEIVEYYKMDIKKFYESVNQKILLKKLSKMTEDSKFLSLMRLFIYEQKTGISTGSCLSPVLSNLYLEDFDQTFERRAGFYSRYVDDILLAPQENISLTEIIKQANTELNSLGLQNNPDKSMIVNAKEGFSYLGFDIKKSNIIDELIQQGNYVMAENILNEEQDGNRYAIEHENTEHYERYQALFIRDRMRHYISKDSQNRYREVAAPLHQDQIHSLVQHKQEFAVAALESNGLCSFAVFDIDISRRFILINGDGGDPFKNLLEQAQMVAKAIKVRLDEKEISGYIEFSGYKGYHVWVFWDKPISLKKQKLFFNQILLGLYVPNWINVEKIPNINEEQKIKLPLSYHSITGEQAYFLTEGEEQLNYIAKIKTSKYNEMRNKQNQNQVQVKEEALEQRECIEIKDDIAETNMLVVKENMYIPPAHIKAIYEQCNITKKIVNKAFSENYIGYHERITLLHIFGCLGGDGEKYLHYLMSQCINYDYAITQRYINNHNCRLPIGCKKLSEQFEGVWGKAECRCNFKNIDMYPSPVAHAKVITPDCFRMPEKEERLGHFKYMRSKDNCEMALSKLVELNKKEYDIHSQQKIFLNQIESLFLRNDLVEIETPQGLLIKNENGLFIKVG